VSLNNESKFSTYLFNDNLIIMILIKHSLYMSNEMYGTSDFGIFVSINALINANPLQ